jgi:hypothetical protein
VQEELLLNHVFAHATEGDVDSVINTIDKFCHEKDGWMMNGQKEGILRWVCSALWLDRQGR